ncbi:MAG TPA: hypothetical protein VF799_05355 [Geobacteraceae bacterium]
MRICIQTSTGKLIEAQSGGALEEHLNALRENAIAAGFAPTDIETRYISDEDFKKLIPIDVQGALTQAVQSHLDITAQQRNYDGILSACSYATSTNARFQAEGQACVAWRDAVWSKCYEVLAAVQAGTAAIPTADQLIADLPTLAWPD